MAANTMYKMKPIYGNSEVVQDYPTCMYKMKNIHGGASDDMATEDTEILELINRQETVLKELEKLKQEVDQIGVEIGINRESIPVEVSGEKHSHIVQEAASCNLVVKASPEDPPLSVVLLYRLVQQHGLDCSVLSHTHSSCAVEVPQELNKLFNTCKKDSSVCLRFIWKSDILAPSLMVSVASQSPILGETNILRYLTRQFLPNLYNRQPLEIAAIDDWLDAAPKLSSSKDGKTFIQNLSTYLGKHNWLSGNTLSIADIYCSVALLKNCAGQLPKNVLKWIAECRKEIPGFEEIEKLLK